VGPRLKSDRERFSPNNILLMITGGGLLWMGWAGFNGGAPYAANITASVAVLNTNVSAATSLLTWTCLDVMFFNKPSVIGAVQGMMTGLVCITPGAGVTNQLLLPYVSLYTAVRVASVRSSRLPCVSETPMCRVTSVKMLVADWVRPRGLIAFGVWTFPAGFNINCLEIQSG
jgi:ammonia channel protein AmtB